MALADMGQAEREFAETDAYATLPPGPYQDELSGLVAQIYMRGARYEQALALLDQMLATAERLGAGLHRAEFHRLKSQAIPTHHPPRTAEAETSFRQAIEIAKLQSAKWWELRATTSLAHLLRDTDRRDEARASLAKIYNWFKEGFDTADLKDAKALLDDLNV
jgi:tetratricopeptide (TPR) repeat protein